MNTCKNPACDKQTRNPQYCSVACSNAAAPKRRRKCADGVSLCSKAECDCGGRKRVAQTKVCANPQCGKSFYNPHKWGSLVSYCSPPCRGMGGHNVPDLLTRWLAGEDTASIPLKNSRQKANLRPWARNYLLNEAKWACTKCGWNTPHEATGKPPLEIDHIDGNRRNNSRDNLVVLCPNCHALTPTYRRYNYKHVQELKETEWLDD